MIHSTKIYKIRHTKAYIYVEKPYIQVEQESR